MGRKKNRELQAARQAAKQAGIIDEEISGNLGNPFADLKVDVPEPPPPPPPPEPPKPTKEQLQEAKLSQADKDMLDGFRKAGNMPDAIKIGENFK